MSNVMSTNEQERIVSLGKLGWSARRIERVTGSRRETVAKYLRLAGIPLRPQGRWGHAKPKPVPGEGESKAAMKAPPGTAASSKAAIETPPPRNPSQLSLCEEHRAEIAAAVDKGVCAKVIWEGLQSFRGSYTSVKRFVRPLKAESRSSPPSGVIRTGPGEEAQVDYGEGPMVRDPSTGAYRRARLPPRGARGARATTSTHRTLSARERPAPGQDARPREAAGEGDEDAADAV
jgi:hypothetical protein